MTDVPGGGTGRDAGKPSNDPLAAWRQMVEGMSGAAGGPGALFVSQLEATAEAMRQRREEIRQLITQLTLFDEQLAVFESSLQPILAWSRTWVRMQENAMDPLGLTRRRSEP